MPLHLVHYDYATFTTREEVQPITFLRFSLALYPTLNCGVEYGRSVAYDIRHAQQMSLA